MKCVSCNFISEGVVEPYHPALVAIYQAMQCTQAESTHSSWINYKHTGYLVCPMCHNKTRSVFEYIV